MSRIGRALRLGVAAVLLTAAGASGVSAAPAPSLAATLSDDGACTLTVVATWRGYAVDHVYVTWYRNGQFWATSEAPLAGPNGGTIKGRKATLRVVPTTTTTPSEWTAVVAFYEGTAAAGVVTPPALSVACV